MSKIFLDTNILVYAIDPRDPLKHKKARTRLKDCTTHHEGVISTQVLQEFYVTCTKKLGLATLETKELLQFFSHFQTTLVTPAIIENAIDCSVLHQLSFWDSLIISSAETAKCTEIWTEDLSHNQVIRSVKIVNPFK